MHNQPRRLVHHKHIPVLIHDIQRNILSHNFELVSRPVHHYLHHIERLHAVVAFHRPSVHKDAPCLGGLLHTVAGGFLQTLDKKFVDAQQCLPLVGHKTEMLEELATIDFYCRIG